MTTGPNFIGIGAQRAGTTWLYENLRGHPDIFLPSKKELRFFNFGYDEGLDAYHSHFSAVTDETAVGEITPGYYWNKAALERIADYAPDMRLIFILRSPVERAFSQFELYRDEFKGASFSTALRDRTELIEWGLYGRTMQWIDELFPREQLLLMDYADLSADPLRFLRRVFDFLKVTQDFTPPGVATRVNKVIYPGAQRMISKFGLSWGVDLVKESVVGDWIRSRQAKTRQAISEADRQAIVERISLDVALLNELTGKDFTHWLRLDRG